MTIEQDKQIFADLGRLAEETQDILASEEVAEQVTAAPKKEINKFLSAWLRTGLNEQAFNLDPVTLGYQHLLDMFNQGSFAFTPNEVLPVYLCKDKIARNVLVKGLLAAGNNIIAMPLGTVASIEYSVERGEPTPLTLERLEEQEVMGRLRGFDILVITGQGMWDIENVGIDQSSKKALDFISQWLEAGRGLVIESVSPKGFIGLSKLIQTRAEYNLAYPILEINAQRSGRNSRRGKQ